MAAPAIKRSMNDVRRHPDVIRLLLLLAAQLAGALLMSASSALATLQVVLTVGVAGLALLSRRIEPITLVAAYIVGVENLWRVTGASMPFLLPVYLVLALLIGLPRTKGGAPLKLMAVVFVALLLPSAGTTFLDISLAQARERVAFTIVPLLVLSAAVIRFSGYRVTEHFRRRLIAAVVIPTAGLAFVVLVRTPSFSDITFTNASNFLTSGGFGPDRIAASLGLGALLCVLEAFRERRPAFLVLEVGLALWFTTQSLLTFSRGGMVSALIALAAGLLYVGSRRGLAGRVALIAGGMVALVSLVVFPRLDASTSGALNRRFSDATTERAALARQDLALFQSSPIIGVGAGEAAFTRPGGTIIPSHTEFTRLLAEHGLFGLLAIVLLLGMGATAVRRAPPEYRSYCVSLLVWSLAQMAYANLRLSAVAFVFGLACLRPARPEQRETQVGSAKHEVAVPA